MNSFASESVSYTHLDVYKRQLYAYVVRWPDGQLSTGVFDTEKARINDRSGSDVAHVLLTR